MVGSRQKKRKTTRPIIGLIGGVASGKSFVAELLQELGCVCINADRVGHDLLDSPMILLRIKQSFGSDVIGPDGTVDRNRLGGIVFGDDESSKERREKLNEIMHPAIRASVVREICRLQESDAPPRAIVIDAPLLIEAGWESACDWIFFVDTPETVRLQRARERGWTESHWRDREQSQLDLEKKRRAATHFLPGNASQLELKLKLTRLLEQLDK